MTRFPHFAHLKLSDASEPCTVVDRTQFVKRTSLHAKAPGWKASGLASGEDSEEIEYVPKRDGVATCVRCDRKLTACTEGSPTVGRCILGQAIRRGLGGIQRHVVTCVVVVKAEFCVGALGRSAGAGCSGLW